MSVTRIFFLKEWDDASTDPVEESQCESDSFPFQNSEPPATGKVLSPFVRPHLQYLFANLSEEQLVALVSSATCPTLSADNSARESPSRLLNSLIDGGHAEKLEGLLSDLHTSSAESVEQEVENKLVTLTDSKALSEICVKTQVADISDEMGLTRPVEGANESDSVAATSHLDVDTEKCNAGDGISEVARVVRRSKKRQAPVPPLGGSLVDLNRLSQISQSILDQMEVSSVVDFDPSFVTPDSSPSPSHSSLNEKKMKSKQAGESNLSKMLQLPRLSFPFWQKPKQSGGHSDLPTTPKVTAGKSEVYESFISLHGDPDDPDPDVTQSHSTESERLREMSQSPSTKRRSVAF